MSAFVRYPLLGCLALFMTACGSSGSQTLLSLGAQTGGTTPEAMRGAILNIYQATTKVITTSTATCDSEWTCTRYSGSGGIEIKSAHTADSGETPAGFGTSFVPSGASEGIQLGRVTATSMTGTGMDVTVMTTYYGGWLQNSFFAIVVDEFEENSDDQRIVTAFSQGKATTTNPATLSGYDLSWKGRLFGLGDTTDENLGVIKNHHIRGDVRIDITNSAVDVAFSNLVDLNNSLNNSALDNNDWTWTGLTLSSGSFTDSEMDGQFYGDDHMEVGGTFNRYGVIGAFGAQRIKSTTTP